MVCELQLNKIVTRKLKKKNAGQATEGGPSPAPSQGRALAEDLPPTLLSRDPTPSSSYRSEQRSQKERWLRACPHSEFVENVSTSAVSPLPCPWATCGLPRAQGPCVPQPPTPTTHFQGSLNANLAPAGPAPAAARCQCNPSARLTTFSAQGQRGRPGASLARSATLWRGTGSI